MIYIITSFAMWVGSMTMEHVTYIPWAPWANNWEYSCILHTFRLNLKFGCSITPCTMREVLFISRTFVGHIAHPIIVPFYYPFYWFLIKSLSLKIPTLLTIASYYSNRHYSWLVPTSISSCFVSLFPWRQENGDPCHMLSIEWNMTTHLNNVM